MRKLIAIMLVLVMALSLVACGGASKMTMGTGGTAGTYYAYGGVLGQYIKNHAEIDVVVVSTDGSLVGVVEEVGLTYAKVRTILDPSTKVASQISRTGDMAYTAGSTVEMSRSNRLRLTALERSSGASEGDYLVTSGIGGVYPSGLLIGSVNKIENATDGMTLKGEVELFADILDLKQVMVITYFDGQETDE